MNNRVKPCSRVSCSLTLCIGLCVVVLPWPARAQLGATSGVLEKLYGPVFRRHARVWHQVLYDTSEMDGDIYKKEDVFVRNAFNRSKVVLVEFTAVNRPLTQKEIDGFLAMNAGGSRWELGKDSTADAKYYHRLDDGAIAHWAPGTNGSLLVSAEKPRPGWEKLMTDAEPGPINAHHDPAPADLRAGD